ncbi:MAG: hypothetical protein KGJ09_03700 [Candidatus Omnitrophica bacterium]|nr:hypothetical protein [Candidatus Omnitrophota bacterium]MDE2009164.1 hypothetical protein [Candidatus Omnitrophota bacterium]MDE2213685.1 hypothetical protein [Candidatus Omnitrophota bacterium]MDE2230740.1 hypothetical protein [Candidatus Omnitrophota bacterium]
MRKKIGLLTVLGFLIYMGQAQASVFAGRHYGYYLNGLAVVTGTVQAVGRNTTTVYDQYRNRRVRLVDFSQGEGFHQGDYIRAYYYPQSSQVEWIKKMTVLEYKKKGQNLGYVEKAQK